MKNSQNFLQRFLTTLLLFIGCQVTGHAEPPNLAQLTTSVKAYHDSGAYIRELNHIIGCAHQFILNQYKINKAQKKPQRLAIVLDIDETSISNYDKMARRHFIATHKDLHQEIQAADSPAIQSVLNLYKDARAKHIAVFFVTGRPAYERLATEKNLKFAGFTHWDGLYFRPNDYKRDSIIPFKSSARAQIAKKGYKIIASIGDQCSDLLGGYAIRGFKLPNPFYYLP